MSESGRVPARARRGDRDLQLRHDRSERARARRDPHDAPQCWGCHKQFEPLAFGFSRFDGAGRYVGEMDADGKPLPLDGWVPTGEAEEPQYTDVASYMRMLATNPVIQTCMTEHFIDFATARSSDELRACRPSTSAKSTSRTAARCRRWSRPSCRVRSFEPSCPHRTLSRDPAMRKILSRRTFLHGAGGVLIGLPFLEEMRPRAARAQDASRPCGSSPCSSVSASRATRR